MTLWRWLCSGPSCEPRESAYAFKRLMQIAQDEIEAGGELKAAKVLHRRAHPKLTVGRFQARILRLRARRQA